jgi:hypothetical protein
LLLWHLLWRWDLLWRGVLLEVVAWVVVWRWRWRLVMIWLWMVLRLLLLLLMLLLLLLLLGDGGGRRQMGQGRLRVLGLGRDAGRTLVNLPWLAMDAVAHATGLAGLIQTTLVGVHEVCDVPTLATPLAQADLLLLLHMLLHVLGVLHELLVVLHPSHSGARSRHRRSRGGVRGRQIAILRFALLLSAHAVALPTIRAGREKVLAIRLLKERRLLPLATPAAPMSPVATLVRWRATAQLAVL